MRTSKWLSLALISSLYACSSDPAPGGNTDTDSGVTVNDVVTPTDNATPTDRGPTDTGVRPDVRDSGSTAIDYRNVQTGRACTMDTDCMGDQVCVAFRGGRMCTLPEPCENGSRSAEEMACGERGAVCLRAGQLTNGETIHFCSRGCSATANSEQLGACGAGFVCTGLWLSDAMGLSDTPTGCRPHCTSNAQCAGITIGDAGAMTCNVRTGECGANAVNMALRPDGAGCNPRSTTPQCRGACFGLSSMRPMQGICGSYINLRQTQQCPDYDMETQPVLGRMGDNLGVCIFRNCATNADCTDGTLCVYPEDAMGNPVETETPRCLYATTRQPNGIPVTGDGGVPTDR